MRRRLLLCAVAMLATGGCTRHVDDVSFVSIEAWHEKPTQEWSPPSNLLLRFRTATDLRRAFQDAETDGLWARVSLCPYHDQPYLSMDRVERNGVDLSMADDTPAKRTEAVGEGSQGPQVYEVQLHYTGMQWEPQQASQRQIAIPPDAQDWCAKMSGFAMVGGGLVSNEFRIPKEAIAKALATADMPPRFRK